MDWIFRIFQGIHVLYIKSQIDVQEIVLNVKELAKTIIKHFGPFWSLKGSDHLWHRNWIR